MTAHYHCSPTRGLTQLLPLQPESFAKPAAVYMTLLRPMALMYGIRHFEYTYGYTKEMQMYYLEHFPHAAEALYSGKSASLYLCAPDETEETSIPNERISFQPVKITEEIFIPDVYRALLTEEEKGTLVIHRFETLTEKQQDWIIRAECHEILERKLLSKDSPMAQWMKKTYPQSWQMALEKQLEENLHT